MTLEIRWTPEAEQSFGQIVAYLESEWTEKEVRKFIRRVNTLLTRIAKFPNLFEASASNKMVRKGFVTPQCSLFYEVTHNTIVLLHFWDNRTDPDKRVFK